MNTPEQHEQQFRYQERERRINEYEFHTGHYASENYCARMQEHINKMNELKGKHLNDIADYTAQMQKNGCNTSGGSRRRRAGKHSKKSKKSKKTKSRRH